MNNIKGTSNVLLKATILFSSVDGMVASALIVPLLANIASEYTNAGPWLLQLVSLPSLLMIPAIFITGKLADYFSKKNLLMIGTAIFIIGGLSGIFVNGIMDLVWTRALLGIGCGIVYPMAPAMIAYLYDGEERSQLYGWMNACGGAFSFVLSIGAGYAAMIHWKYAFYYYLIFVVVLILQAVCLPHFPPEKKDTAFKTQSKEKLGSRVWLTSFDMLIFMTVSMTIIYKLALFIVGEHIGTSADAGIASSINTVASFVVCLFFAQILNGLKRFTSVLSLIFMTLSYFTFSIAHAFFMLIVAVVFLGFSMGLMFPYLMDRVAKVASSTNRTIAISILSMSIYLGQFLSAFYAQFVDFVTNNSIREAFTFVASNLFAFTIIAVIYIVITQKSEINDEKIEA